MNANNSTNPPAGPVLGELLTALGMGGAENLAVQIANAHVNAGGTAHLIVLSGPGALSDRVAPGVVVHYLGYRRESIRHPLRFLRSVIRGYRLLAKVVRAEGIEVLQTHLPDANLWGLVMALTTRCRVFVTIHNNVELGNERRSRFNRAMVGSAFRVMFRACDGVVACSEEVKRSIMADLGDSPALGAKVHVVTNGVLPAGEQTATMRSEIRARYGVRDDEFFIIAAGRFTEAKNFACLVDAMAVLKGSGYAPKLVIGGEGPLHAAVKAQVGALGLDDLVQTPGNIPDLLDVMQAADCLALSSRWEGLPLVLLEGMMRGLPVVGTMIKGISEIIRDGVEGRLVETDDPQALAGALAGLIDDPSGAGSMGRAGRAVVEEKYSFARVYRELTAVFGCAR